MQSKPASKVVSLSGGRSLPHSIEAEEAVIGGLLVDPNAIHRVIDILSADGADFYFSQHREIYRAIASLCHEGKPVDLMTVTHQLHKLGRLELAGGQNKLAYFLEFTVSAVNIDYHAALVRERYLRRKLIDAGNEIVRMAQDVGSDVNALVEQAEKLVFEIGQNQRSLGLLPIGNVMTNLYQEVEARSLNPSIPGISCGFYDLDAMTQGFQRSHLVIMAGRPAMGKTSFAMNIARNIAAIHKLPVAVFSLEMSADELGLRLSSAESGLISGQIKSAKLSGDDWAAFGTAVFSLGGIPIAIDDTPIQTCASIRSKARRFQAEQGGRLGGIVIDYLQLMEGAEAEQGNRVEVLSRITRGLKHLARELKVPVFALSQLNRGVESRTNKRPMMSDLRESGSIEQDADLIIMLYRDEYYNPDTPDRGIAEAIVTKHRNGPTGTIKLLFEPHFSRFRNLAR